MHCNEVISFLDEYLDESLTKLETDGISAHLADCSVCAAEFNRHQSQHDLLKSLPVHGPDENFLDRAVTRAAQANQVPQTGQRHRGGDPASTRSFAVRGAMAAAAALVFVVAVMTMPPQGTSTAPSAGYPEVTLATDTVTPVKLMFASEVALRDARLSIQLPVGVELVGYSSRSNLSWTTDLEPGNNILRLPLVGRIALSDQVIATLEHPKGTKTFRLQVTVN